MSGRGLKLVEEAGINPDGEVGRFSGTALVEAERPQRKRFEPEGRVFAAAAKRDPERSKNVYSREG